MRRVLLLGSLVALAVVAIPGPSASVSVSIRSPEVRQYEPKAAPEPRTAAPTPSAAFTLTASDAWDGVAVCLADVRPDYGPAFAYCVAPLSPAVRKRPQVWEYG